MKKFIILIGTLYFLISCVNIKNTKISEESAYVVNPTIYHETRMIDIPLPVTGGNSNFIISEETKNKMAQLVANYSEAYNPTGMGLSVYINGCPWSYFSGYSDADKSVPVSGETLFHSASSGKIIMATIIFSIIQDGDLSLNDPISNWFGDEALFEGITIDHLLSHTSGIVTFEIIKKFQNNTRVWSEAELIELVLETQKQKLFPPGTAFHYSNTGYVMLGIIAQRLTGETLDDLFNARIKRKADLKNIFYISESNYNKFTTASFNLNGDSISLPEASYASGPHGAGAFAGTPADFSRFLNALFSEKIIRQPALNLMMSHFRLCEESDQVKVYYGRGLQLIRIAVPGKESDYIGHSGQYTGFGFTSQLYHCMERNVTVCAMTNQEVVTQPLVFRLSEEFSY
jgi:CubicO group peptidase (beta-lactamase class C family)